LALSAFRPEDLVLLLGLEDRMGSLEVGKDADIAIFNGDPFCNYTKCTETIIDGVVFKH
ncbi:MAG: amidohydrolase family protein, partial [Clostridia bacterium]|nr:amidohydrolase family protein [Clostridia bacterium]